MKIINENKNDIFNDFGSRDYLISVLYLQSLNMENMPY